MAPDLGGFEKMMHLYMGRLTTEMLDNDDRWLGWWMTADEKKAYQDQRQWEKAHPNECSACVGIRYFAKAQLAEFTLRYCRWATEHPETVGPFHLVVLVPHNCDGYETPEFILTNLSAQQLGALEDLAWPRYRYDDNAVGFADWLIRMRLADPPTDAPLVVTYDV